MSRVDEDEIVEELTDEIRPWLREGRVGSLEINFFKGGVSNVNMKESKRLRSSVTRKEGR